jgi:hypothetical protein
VGGTWIISEPTNILAMRVNNPLYFGLSRQVLVVSGWSTNFKARLEKYFTMFELFSAYFAP